MNFLHAQQLEEHAMAHYPNDHAKWEFKIIRSTFGQFANQETRDGILAKEAEAQWEVMEILDASRIRLRRPVDARELDGKLDFDPYRILVDSPQMNLKVGVMVLAIVGFVVLGGGALAVILENI